MARMIEMETHSDPSAEPLLNDQIEGPTLPQRESVYPEEETALQVEHSYILPVQEKECSVKRRSTAYLDGLRGVAALCVFTQHFMGGNAQNHGFGENGYFYLISFPFLRVFWTGGSAAVSIFFVLSGFVLSQTSVKLNQRGQQRDSKRSLISAAIRRPIRLYLPCFAVGLIVAMAKYLPWHIYPELGYSPRRGNIGVEFLHWFHTTITFFNPFRKHGFKYGVYEYVLILWTIPIELKGSYLIWFLCAVGCFVKGSAECAALVMLTIAIVVLHFGFWTSGCFIAGLLLTLNHLYELDNTWAFCRFPSIVKTVFVNLMFVVGWYLLSGPVADDHPEWSLDTPGWHFLTSLIPESYDADTYYRFWHSYGAIIFVWSTLHLSWVQCIFSTRPLKYLGRVSFMLYAIHLPLIICFGRRMERAFGRIPATTEPKWWDNILYVPNLGPLGLSLQWDIIWTIQLAFTLAMAELATRFIDDPCVRLGKCIVRKIGLD